MQEFNNVDFVQDVTTETQSTAREINLFADNPTFQERPDVEQSTPTKKVVKQKFDYKKLLSAIMTVVMAGTVLGVTVILPTQQQTSPLNDLQLQLVEFGATEWGEVFFHLVIQSDAPLDQLPLEARVYNDFLKREQPLTLERDGDDIYAGGVIEGLKGGVAYTFEVYAKQLLGDKVFVTRKIVVPYQNDPINNVTVTIYDCSMDGNNMYFTVEADSDLPLYVLLMQNGVETRRIPFALETDGVPSDPYRGSMFCEIADVTLRSDTVIQVVAQDLLGEWQVLTQYVVDPINFAYVEVVECAFDGGAIYFTVEADADLPLEIVLMENGVETQRQAFDLTNGGLTDGNPTDPYNGTMEGQFTNVTEAENYLSLIVGKDVDGYEVVLCEYNPSIENQP